ncbi:hypothetical protein MMC21_006034 [Puttea exsequens]|nr:hypothetical protein [Puttea exsequens]
MPPPDFWVHVERQMQYTPQHKRTETVWPSVRLEPTPESQSNPMAEDTSSVAEQKFLPRTRSPSEPVWPNVTSLRVTKRDPRTAPVRTPAPAGVWPSPEDFRSPNNVAYMEIPTSSEVNPKRPPESQHKRTKTVWPTPETMNSPNTFASITQSTTKSPKRVPLLLVSPEKAVLRLNQKTDNIMDLGSKGSFEMITAGSKRTYENMRKGSKEAAGIDYGRLREDGLWYERKDSRTLVKQRQPWDKEPRMERKKGSI